MNPSRSLLLLLLLSLFNSTSCSSESVKPTSSTGALTANSAIESLAKRPFDRSILAVGGLNTLNEFIRSDVRSRMDEESTGDTAGIYEPPSVDVSSATVEEPKAEDPPTPLEQSQQAPNTDEDTFASGQIADAKFQWAKRSFGDALKTNPTAHGVIVLFADENIYDINSLMRYIEEGRGRIAEKSEIPIERLQVVFGGYRGLPQVEFWMLPEGAAMPEFKTEDRNKAGDPEN